MTEPPREKSPEDRFIDHLGTLHERRDRAALASLRRVVGKRSGDVPRADRLILPWLPPSASERRLAAWYLVAGLFATHPEQSPVRCSFGESFRQLCQAKKRPSLELRFQAVLKAHEDEVPDHLRRLVQLLRSEGIPVDWAQLLRDVLFWSDGDRRVQRRWARDFWAATETDREPSNS